MSRRVTRRKTTPETRASGNFLRRVYTQPQIKHEKLIWIYTEINTLLEECALLIGGHTRFLDHFVVDCFLRVSSSTLRNKAIFESDDNLEKRGLTGTSLRAPYEQSLMNIGIEFLYTTSTGSSAAERPFDKLWGKLPFVPAVYDILTESFMRIVEGYTRLIEEGVHIRNRVTVGTPNPDDLSRLSEVEAETADIEQKVGGERMTLYGVVQQVKDKMCVVLDYQAHITRAYERLVLQLAKRYGRSPMQIEDNFQQGMFGLRRAIRYFDPRRGKAFSGIARWWIQAAILITIKEEANLVKVPTSVWRLHERYEATAHEHGVMGDLGAIAELHGHSREQVEEVYAAVHMNRPRSLEDPISSRESNEGRFGDKIEDTKPSPEDELTEQPTEIPTYLEQLSTDERTVVCCAYGMYDYLPTTVKENPDLRVIEKLCQIGARAFHTYQTEGLLCPS